MRTIKKGSEPASLTRYRSGQSSEVTHSYDDFPDKQDLRDSLCREQRGICCYCMGRIRPKSESMKIEHWRSQSKFPEEQLNYGNLLGVCLGGEGSLGQQHCDTAKANREMSVNPADQTANIERRISYRPDGTIRAEEPSLERDLNEVLNLNKNFLKTNRKRVLTGFQKALGKGSLDRGRLKRFLDLWNGDSNSEELRPYCQVVVYWLQKRLNRP